jgi:hypothetical protein
MTYTQLSLFTDEELGITSRSIIGLNGYARSGKDTIANILIKEHGYTRVGFADAIREFLLTVNPILEDGHRLHEIVALFNWEIAKAKTEVRRLLQVTGTTARDMFGEDFWINQVINKIKTIDKVVITDVRFTNEADAIKLLGGQIWKVERPGVSAINSHISEIDMDNYTPDRLIVNSGSIKDLSSLVLESLNAQSAEKAQGI